MAIIITVSTTAQLKISADVVKLVNTIDLGSIAERLASSNLVFSTKYGGVSEQAYEVVSKTTANALRVRFPPPLPNMEQYSRGRRGSPAKGVGQVTVARVQIPSAPPLLHDNYSVLYVFVDWLLADNIKNQPNTQVSYSGQYISLPS